MSRGSEFPAYPRNILHSANVSGFRRLYGQCGPARGCRSVISLRCLCWRTIWLSCDDGCEVGGANISDRRDGRVVRISRCSLSHSSFSFISSWITVTSRRVMYWRWCGSRLLYIRNSACCLLMLPWHGMSICTSIIYS